MIGNAAELQAEVDRLRGLREATVQAIEDAVNDLDIEHLAAYDVERIARVACAQFRVADVKQLRDMLEDICNVAVVQARPTAKVFVLGIVEDYRAQAGLDPTAAVYRREAGLS